MKNKTVTLGMLLALALVFAYVETLIPLPFGVPGMKLGLPNLMTVLLLYRYGAKEALLTNLLRVVLSGFLFGGLNAILFSMTGALAAFCGMVLVRRTDRTGIAGVSLTGGVLHNLGQLAIAARIVKTGSVLAFLPPLLVAGALTGFVIGILAERILPLLSKMT